MHLLEGADHYWWRPDVERWFRGDLQGFVNQAGWYGATWHRFGEYVTHEQWEALIPIMTNDKDFPP